MGEHLTRYPEPQKGKKITEIQLTSQDNILASKLRVHVSAHRSGYQLKSEADLL